MPMGFRVWLGVSAMLALVTGSVLLAVLLILGLRTHETGLQARSVPFATAVAASALDAKSVANDQRGFLMTGDRRFIVEADQRIVDARASLTASRAAASTPAQRRAIGDARAGFERWVQAIHREFAEYSTSDRSRVVAESLGADRAQRKRYEAALGTAQTLATSGLRSADASMQAASTRSIAILLACLIVSLITGLGIGYWLVRTIAVPVARLLSIFAGVHELTVIR
jgi:methyl-accepting chemotaxis protein